VNLTAMVNLMLEQAKLEIQEADLACAASFSSADSAIDEEEEDYEEREMLAAAVGDVESLCRAGYGKRFGGSIASNRSQSVADLIQGSTRDWRQDPAFNNGHSRHVAEPEPLRPYLLLDVRSEEAFERKHVRTSECYPLSRLSRALNFESKSMFAYRNRPGKIVVVYDDDEMAASKAATTLAQRGYDNVFMLSGGLRLLDAAFGAEAALISSGTSEGEEEAFSEGQILDLEEKLDDLMSRASRGGRGSSASSYAPVLARRRLSASHPDLNRRRL